MGAQGEIADMLAREAYETRLAAQTGLSALTQDAALARIPIYAFGIAGLIVDGPAVNTAAPPGHSLPRFTERMALAGNDGLRTLAGASGGRAFVDDNEPARAV